MDQQEAVLVGVNKFQLDEHREIPLQVIDPSLEPKQVERLKALRARRDPEEWSAAVQAVEDAARNG